MAHMIRSLECKNGHSIGIGYDKNNCGCHHNGKPCLVINCQKCFEDSLNANRIDANTKINTTAIYIPLDEEGAKVVEELFSPWTQEDKE